jgi:hypothetical protein
MSEVKRRGRPKASLTEQQANESRVGLQESREVKARGKKRPPRVAMSATKKLAYSDQDENYFYRWFQDRDGRLEQAQQAWYEFVKDENGERIRRPGHYDMYLMRIDREYWEEDQELKLKKTKAKLGSEQELGRDEYIPDGRHHVLQKDDYDPLG